MAYTPINWQTGDTITAEKLNKMDRGWDIVAGTSTQLFSETVTTAGDKMYVGQLVYSQPITADSITVTYDGTEYTCPSIGAYEYGAPYSDNSFDFSEFPFNLYANGETYIITQTAGEHTVAVATVVTSTQVSADFAAAVNAVVDVSSLPLRCVEGVTTFVEAGNALKSGRLVYFMAPEDSYEGAPTHAFLISLVSSTCTIVPTSTKIAAKFSRDGSSLFYIEHLSS